MQAWCMGPLCIEVPSRCALQVLRGEVCAEVHPHYWGGLWRQTGEAWGLRCEFMQLGAASMHRSKQR